MGRILSSIVLLIVVMPLGVAAQQSELESKIAQCAAIEGDLERLECYDSIAREMGLVATSSVLPVDGVGKWTVQEDSNPIDDSKTVVLAIRADEGASSWGTPVGLVIRCKSNNTEVYINWGEYLGSEARVTCRVGSEKATSSMWGLSTDSKATFYPGNDIEFVKRLMVAEKFVAQVTPYGESPVTAVFDISGLTQAVKPLQATCGWE